MDDMVEVEMSCGWVLVRQRGRRNEIEAKAGRQAGTVYECSGRLPFRVSVYALENYTCFVAILVARGNLFSCRHLFMVTRT